MGMYGLTCHPCGFEYTTDRLDIFSDHTLRDWFGLVCVV